MSTPTPTELLAFLQEHQFLTTSQWQQIGGGLTKFAESRTLVRELVERKILTAFQGSLILQGRGKNLLFGPYRLLERLGEGGMGQVFKARHLNMDRVVALKIIPKELVSNPLAVSRFYREARAVASLSHPNIVTAFDVNSVGQTHYLAMELVDGIDLARLVQQSGPLAVTQACDYIRQAAIGLQHANENGLVHRDIKPGNLMVARSRSDEPPIIKILDFGLARFESESDHTTRLTQLGQIVGTVDYIAPEQSQNARMVDIRADIYSLGCSLFYLLTGNPPFLGDDAAEKISARVLEDVPFVRKSRPEVSPALEQVLAKMTARNPADRYQTPGEVAKALKPFSEEETEALSRSTALSDRPIGDTSKQLTVAITHQRAIAQPVAPFPSMQPNGGLETRKRVKSPFWIALAGALVLLVALIGAIVFALKHDPGVSKREQIQPAESEKTATPLFPDQPTEDAPKSAITVSADHRAKQSRELASDPEPKPPPLPEPPRRQAVQTTPTNEKPAEQAKSSAPPRREGPEVHWLPANVQKQVNRSIERGVEFLRRRQNTDGSWGHQTGAAGKRYTPGITALSALTMLECGVPPKDSHIHSAANYLRQRMPELTNTYSISLAILFFDRLGDESDVARIRTLALRLIAGQKTSGGWDYSCPKHSAEEELGLLALLYKDRPATALDLFAEERKSKETKLDSELYRPRPSKVPPLELFLAQDPKAAIPASRSQAETGNETNDKGKADATLPGDKRRLSTRALEAADKLPEPLRGTPALRSAELLRQPPDFGEQRTDNSNTQFAILGLLIAENYDVPMERAMALVDWRFRNSMTKQGAWNYRPDWQLTPSMTAAALMGLALKHGLLLPNRSGRGRNIAVHDDEIIHQGFSSLTGMLESYYASFSSQQLPLDQLDLYCLWTVERVAVLYNVRQLGSLEWYPPGVQLLLPLQREDGSWGTKGTTCLGEPSVTSSLALLFLKRSDPARGLTERLNASAEILEKSETKASIDSAKGRPALPQPKKDELAQKNDKAIKVEEAKKAESPKNEDAYRRAGLKLPPLPAKLKGYETDKDVAEKKMLRQSKVTAEVSSVDEDKKSLRLRLTIPYVKINERELYNYYIAKNLQQMREAQAKTYELATTQKEVEWTAADEYKVRMSSPPP